MAGAIALNFPRQQEQPGGAMGSSSCSQLQKNHQRPNSSSPRTPRLQADMAGAIAENFLKQQQQQPEANLGSSSMKKETQRLTASPAPRPPPRLQNPSESSLSSSSSSSSSLASSSSLPKIRVVTFDLDNTLWCTTSTIGAALAAVDKFWDSQSIQPAVCTEDIMKELFACNKAKYAPLQSNQATCPSQFTQLRLDAMQHLLTKHHNFSSPQAADLAQRAMNVMSRARHEAIHRHMAAEVVATLQRLHHNSSSNHEHLIIGAITDGNANPRRVNALKPFFDFCIQAEHIGVSKPDARIFHQAIHKVQQILMSSSSSCIGDFSSSISTQELLAGWVHVGDDWTKDIVGAKQVGMRTIWCRELVLASPSSSTKSSSSSACCSRPDLSSWDNNDNTAETTHAATMPASSCTNALLGANEENASSADAIVDRFADIATVLEDWQREK